MLSMYLAWSVYKLVGTLVVWALIVAGMFWLGSKGKVTNYKKITSGIAVFWLVLIVMGAINVGDRQKELDRQRFDATMPVIQQQEKIESQRRTVESVKENFEQAVKHTSPKE